MDSVAMYTCAAIPSCRWASPLVAIVWMPVRNVVGDSGNGGGSHRSCPIGGAASRFGAVRIMCLEVSVNRHACRTDGRMRYIHVRRFRWFGTVNAVPDNCSVYRPNGAFWGLFCPSGNAPGIASDASSLPNPDRYSS